MYVCMCVLSALSRCVFFQQCTCQNVSSLGRGPCVCVCVCVCMSSLFCPKRIVKMCRVLAMHLSRCVVCGQGTLCVCVCVLPFYFALNALSRCVVFRLCTCQSRCVVFGQRALCVCACVCALSFYFCPNCIVKMCRLSAMHLSRCVVFGRGGGGALCVGLAIGLWRKWGPSRKLH